MMPCRTIDLGNGASAIACSRGQRAKLCVAPACGRPSTVLCDFPLVGGRAGATCDRPICRAHAKHVGPDRDYCPSHAKEPQ